MSDLSLGGLATGMDTASIIDQLVQLERRPIYNYQTEISELEQTKGAWRDINSRLDKLEDKMSDLKLSATYTARKAVSSNEDAASATASNDSIEGNYSLIIQSTARAQRIAGAKMTDSTTALKDMAGFTALNTENIININGTDINISDSDSLNEISEKINGADTGVRASIVDNHLVLETEATGIDNALDSGSADTNITDASGVLEGLGILDTGGNILNELQAAEDAEIDINGITGITSSTNTFSEAVEGLNIKLNPEAEAGDTTTISVSKDTQKAVKAVQSFVDQYNSVMNFIDGKTEYDQENEKGAILQGDGTAMRLQMRLREMVSSRVKSESNYKSLSSVGIEIDRDGVMSLESDKLTEALENSPEEAAKLFQGEADTDGFDGVAVRMDSYLDQMLQSNTGLIPTRLDFFDNRIDDLNDSIEDVERKVEMTRERYVEQFTAMEKAISEMQSQQSWMMSQLSSMGGSGSSMSSML